MSERVYVHQVGHKLPIHVPALHHTPSCGRCEFHKQTGAICISPEGQPGGLLIVSDYPGQTESQYNRPLCGQEGQYLRGVMLKHWFGNWALTSALGCKPTGDVDESHIDACRPYLSKTIADVQPELIMLMGPWAGLSFFGEKYQPLSARGGHGWWQNPVSGKQVPVATMISPSMAIRNTLVAKAFEADFREVVLRYNERTFSRPNKNLYVEVVDMQNVSFVLSELEKADYTGFDTETSGLMYDPTFRIESIVLWGVRDGVITRGFLWDREQIEDPILREPLGRALASSQIRKVGFNSKYDIQAVLSEKLLGAFAGFHSDARIKRKLLAADAQGSLAACSPLVGVIGHKAEAEHCVSEICADLNRITKYREYCSDPSNKPKAPPKLNIVNPTEVPHTTTDAIAAGHEPEKFAYRYIPRPIRRRYNALDVLTTVGIEEWANERIGLGQFLPVWEEIAAPATLAMVEMEQRGILVDRPKLQAFSGYLGQKIKMELTKLQAISPDINPASPKQVSEAIGKLGLKIKAKTASGGISTSETALEALKGKHIFIDSLLEWRRLSKLKSTYADGYQIFIRGDSRIHTSYLLDGTETGRSSSSNPNMSVLPRNKDAEGNSEGQMLRDCFVAKPDHFLLEVDRKQIEIYIAAYLSKDPKMMEILMRPNADFHMGAARMCSKVAWSIEPDAVTKEQRQEMKTSVFAVLYELPDKLGWLLSKRLKCSVEQGEKLATALFGNFDRLEEWMMEQLTFAQVNGYAQTEWRGRAARQRMLWGLGDTTMEHQGIRDNAKRSSWNGPVQGTSADLTTADLLPVQQALRKAKLRCYPELTIYDSIIFEVHEDDLYESFDVVRQVMTRHDLHPLKLGVDGKYGKSLGSMVDLEE